MGDIKEVWRRNKKANRELDKKLGEIYRTWEQMPNESFTDFKRRFKKTKRYPF